MADLPHTWINRRFTWRMLGDPSRVAWLHRLTGILLLVYLWGHILTLASLAEPERFQQKLAFFRRLGLSCFEWLLAMPVILHALNGLRLVLYELFAERRDELLLGWVFVVSAAYVLAAFMLSVWVHVDPATYLWLLAWLMSMTATAAGYVRAVRSPMGPFWKLQRLSGMFLLIMVPAHLLLMHANPAVGHDPAIILSRIRHQPLIRITDIAVMVCALYHGAYGTLSILKDYIAADVGIRILGTLITAASVFFGWVGLRTLMLL